MNTEIAYGVFFHLFSVELLCLLVVILFSFKTTIQQLHSSVRTGSLETCLRLLSLGAQANFFHPVRKNKTKHIFLALI